MTANNSASIRKANTLLSLQFLSDFGDQISIALLAILLLDITQSTGKVGLVYFITTVGYIVFTFVGGFIGDRLSRKNILFYSDFGRGLVVLLMILALKEKSISLIYCTSFLLSVLGSLNRPAKLCIWTESIPSHALERYNSLSEFSIQASTILGPLIASFFILQELPNLGFVIDAMTFFACAIAFVQMAFAQEKPARCDETKSKRDFLTGFRIILQRPDMSRFIAYDAIQMIGFGAFNATFLVLAQRDFGWSKGDYSYHLSIVALFTTLGALMGATSYVAKIDQMTKLISCALLSAFALGVVLYLQSFPMGSILIGICDGLAVLTMAVTRTRVQLIAKNDYPNSLSSIIAARFIIVKAAILLGTGCCLLVEDVLSLKFTLALNLIPIGLSFLPLVMDQREETAIRSLSSIPKAIK